MTTNIIIDPVTEDIVVYVNEGVADGVTLNGTQTVTNKTFPSPKITGALLDTNGNELLKVTATASAVNELTLANAATAGAPSLTASGDDVDIDINLVPKGTGKVEVNGVPLLSSIATNKLTGRSTAGTGAVEEISVGSGLTLSSGTLSAAGSSNLNGITAATGSATLANGNNPIAWNWTQTTAAQTGFGIGETTASTGGSGSQILYNIKTLAGSTANPFRVQTRGVDTINISRTGAVTITALDGTTGAGGTGSDVNISGGQGQAVNFGGLISLVSGAGGATSGGSGVISLLTGTTTNGNTGNISLTTGNAGVSGGTSGNINLTVGTMGGNAAAGIINITGGRSRAVQVGNSGGVVITGGQAGTIASIAGGPVVITGGAGSATTTGGVGGAVTIQAGAGGLAAAGGDLSLFGGATSSGQGGSVIIQPGSGASSTGNVQIQAAAITSATALGTMSIAAGFNLGTGLGGAVNIASGGSNGATGANVTITAGGATTNGGNIVLTPGTGTSPGMVKMGPSSLNVGYLEIPQNSQSAAYTLVLTDSGKHILHPSADTTARTFTIPANASVAYPVGTAITFVNQNAAGVVTIAITTDTMRLAGAGTTGSRTLAANGVATAIKITTTEWIISGTGLI